MKSPKQITPKYSEGVEKDFRLERNIHNDVPTPMPVRSPPVIPQKARDFSNLFLEESQSARETQSKQLLIGKDISLSGTINSCEKLIIAGTVETKISECKDLEIARGGLFKGEAKIEKAEIAGEFFGSLSADYLIIRNSGRVSGELTYGKLEVECGGEVVGNITKIGGNTEF